MTDAERIAHLEATLASVKRYAAQMRRSNRLTSPFEDHARRQIWVQTRYADGKAIYEMIRDALSE